MAKELVNRCLLLTRLHWRLLTPNPHRLLRLWPLHYHYPRHRQALLRLHWLVAERGKVPGPALRA